MKTPRDSVLHVLDQIHALGIEAGKFRQFWARATCDPMIDPLDPVVKLLVLTSRFEKLVPAASSLDREVDKGLVGPSDLRWQLAPAERFVLRNLYQHFTRGADAMFFAARRDGVLAVHASTETGRGGNDGDLEQKLRVYQETVIDQLLPRNSILFHVNGAVLDTRKKRQERISHPNRLRPERG